MTDIPHPERRPIDGVVDALQPWLQHRLAGSVLLTISAVLAFVWANSPLQDSHEALLTTTFTVQLGTVGLSKALVLWINDGLMSVFFFVIGLEVKHELLEGALNTPRKAALPAIAAVGGMVVPAALYLLVADADARPGFGIPIATDIAFALGVLALLGGRAPLALTAFLSAVAIADDIGAIIVIAVAYTEEVSTISLAIGAAMVGIAFAMNVAGVRREGLYFVVGLVCWVAFLKSGLHATIAAVLMAFAIPARTRLNARAFAAGMTRLVERLTVATSRAPAGTRLLKREEINAIETIEVYIERGTTPLQRLEHALLPVVTFAILPSSPSPTPASPSAGAPRASSPPPPWGRPWASWWANPSASWAPLFSPRGSACGCRRGSAPDTSSAPASCAASASPCPSSSRAWPSQRRRWRTSWRRPRRRCSWPRWSAASWGSWCSGAWGASPPWSLQGHKSHKGHKNHKSHKSHKSHKRAERRGAARGPSGAPQQGHVASPHHLPAALGLQHQGAVVVKVHRPPLDGGRAVAGDAHRPAQGGGALPQRPQHAPKGRVLDHRRRRRQRRHHGGQQTPTPTLGVVHVVEEGAGGGEVVAKAPRGGGQVEAQPHRAGRQGVGGASLPDLEDLQQQPRRLAKGAKGGRRRRRRDQDVVGPLEGVGQAVAGEDLADGHHRTQRQARRQGQRGSPAAAARSW